MNRKERRMHERKMKKLNKKKSVIPNVFPEFPKVPKHKVNYKEVFINQFVENDFVKDSLVSANAFLKDALIENNAEKIEYLMMIKEQFENATCEVKDYVATIRFNNEDFCYETIITATDDALIHNENKLKFECDIAA